VGQVGGKEGGDSCGPLGDLGLRGAGLRRRFIGAGRPAVVGDGGGDAPVEYGGGGRAWEHH
jgi:hypothetical protein